MNAIVKVIGLNIAKNVFVAVGVDQNGQNASEVQANEGDNVVDFCQYTCSDDRD